MRVLYGVGPLKKSAVNFSICHHARYFTDFQGQEEMKEDGKRGGGIRRRNDRRAKKREIQNNSSFRKQELRE